jgi:hypothetical protein
MERCFGNLHQAIDGSRHRMAGGQHPGQAKNGIQKAEAARLEGRYRGGRGITIGLETDAVEGGQVGKTQQLKKGCE